MARTFSGTATATPANHVVTGLPAVEITLFNLGAAVLQVNVPSIHGDEYADIPVGECLPFCDPNSNITEFNVKSPSSTTYTGSVTIGSIE